MGHYVSEMDDYDSYMLPKSKKETKPITLPVCEIEEITNILAATMSGTVQFNRDQLDMANQRIVNLEEGIRRSLDLLYEKLGVSNE
jgi:hypothetical protein